MDTLRRVARRWRLYGSSGSGQRVRSTPWSLDAIGQLCDEHGPALFRVAMVDLDETEAARAVSDVLCAAVRGSAEDTGRESLAAPLALRVHRYSRRLAAAYATLSPRLVPAFLEGLSEAQREVIVLAVAGRIAYRDIADLLDVDAQWVAVELRSGLLALTDRAVTATGQDRIAGVHADEEVQPGRQLREALHRRAVMEQAKGLLMSLHGCDADRASELVTQVAQQHQVAVHDVAGAFVALAAGGGQAPMEARPQTAEAARGAPGSRRKASASHLEPGPPE